MADVTNTFYLNDGAIHGYGAQWLIGDGASPESFQAVKAVMRIVPGAMKTADINRTHLRSPAAHHEHMPGLRDSGPFQITGTWLPNDESQSNTGGGAGSFTQGGLVALWISRETRNMKLVLNDGSPATEWPFSGYISQFQPGEIGPDDKITFTASVQPVGDFSSDLP